MFYVEIIFVILFVIFVFSPLIAALCYLIYENINNKYNSKEERKKKLFKILKIPEDRLEQEAYYSLLEKKLYRDIKVGDIYFKIPKYNKDIDIRDYLFIKKLDNSNIDSEALDIIVSPIPVSKKDRKKIFKILKLKLEIN